MSFDKDIKLLRTKANLTQQELADQLYVTRQTVSTWEMGKNMPSLETVYALSQLFDVTLEQLLFSEVDMMEKKPEKSLAMKIDRDVRMKKRYLIWTLSLGILIAILTLIMGILWLGYDRGIDKIDRVNPFISYQVGYTKLPSEKKILPNNKSTNGYWTAWFSDSVMGNKWTKLRLTTGINPGIKDPYVMAYHKGSYVKEARIVPKTDVNQAYVSDLKALDSLVNNKHEKALTPTIKQFDQQIHVSEKVR